MRNVAFATKNGGLKSFEGREREREREEGVRENAPSRGDIYFPFRTREREKKRPSSRWSNLATTTTTMMRVWSGDRDD